MNEELRVQIIQIVERIRDEAWDDFELTTEECVHEVGLLVQRWAARVSAYPNAVRLYDGAHPDAD